MDTESDFINDANSVNFRITIADYYPKEVPLSGRNGHYYPYDNMKSALIKCHQDTGHVVFDVQKWGNYPYAGKWCGKYVVAKHRDIYHVYKVAEE